MSLQVYLAVQLQKEVHQEFCNPRCCAQFPSAILIRLVGHKMFLRPVLVDLVDRVASSILTQPAVLSKSSVPFGKAHPSSSCVPLSLCKQLAVCRRGRLHATLSGKKTIISLQRASNCTNILHPDEVSKDFFIEQSLGLSSRMKFPPHNFHLPSSSPLEHGLSSSFETLSSRDQPTSNY